MWGNLRFCPGFGSLVGEVPWFPDRALTLKILRCPFSNLIFIRAIDGSNHRSAILNAFFFVVIVYIHNDWAPCFHDRWYPHNKFRINDIDISCLNIKFEPNIVPRCCPDDLIANIEIEISNISDILPRKKLIQFCQIRNELLLFSSFIA